jgi:CRP-like cAMP-binding protein
MTSTITIRRPPGAENTAGPPICAISGGGEHRQALTADFLAGRMRHLLADDDLLRLEQAVSGTRQLADGEVLSARGTRLTEAALLVEGVMFRTIMRDQRRFIVGICVPGDFVDLHGLVLQRLDHTIVAAGPARVATISHAALDGVIVGHPILARALWFASLLDAAIHRRWIQMLERNDAPRRIAHIFCELYERLQFTGRARDDAVPTPFSQCDLADMCGISTIHANRAVSKLREVELADLRRGTFYPRDWEGLRRYAHFEPGYLFGAPPA